MKREVEYDCACLFSPAEAKHVPLYMENFVFKKNDSSIWNAYTAGDEAAHINKQVMRTRQLSVSRVSGLTESSSPLIGVF